MGKSEAKFRANLFASNGDMELYKLREAIRLEVRVFRPHEEQNFTTVRLEHRALGQRRKDTREVRWSKVRGPA